MSALGGGRGAGWALITVRALVSAPGDCIAASSRACAPTTPPWRGIEAGVTTGVLTSDLCSHFQNFFVRPKSSPPRKVRAAFSIGGGDLARHLGNAGPRGFQRPRAPGCARAHSRQALSSVRQDTHGSPPAHQRLLPEPTLQCVRMCAPVGGLLAALAMVFGMAVAFAPKPRITWEHRGTGQPCSRGRAGAWGTGNTCAARSGTAA